MEGPTHRIEKTPLEQLHSEAESLKARHSDVRDLVIGIQNFLRKRASSIPKEQRKQPETILESRLTSAEEAFQGGMLSCGTLATMSAEMLRHLGYEVRLVHGESAESVDHAWIEVKNPDSEQWEAYDLTRGEADVPDTHVKKREVQSWYEIRDQLESDHETMIERRRERGLPPHLEA